MADPSAAPSQCSGNVGSTVNARNSLIAIPVICTPLAPARQPVLLGFSSFIRTKCFGFTGQANTVSALIGSGCQVAFLSLHSALASYLPSFKQLGLYTCDEHSGGRGHRRMTAVVGQSLVSNGFIVFCRLLIFNRQWKMLGRRLQTAVLLV